MPEKSKASFNGTKMKITVLGSGNAFNTSGRFHACYLLESDRFSLLLDCGATSLAALQKRKFDLGELDFVLLTHFHGDHTFGLPFVLIQMDIILSRKKELIIHGPPGVEEFCRRLIETAYPGFLPRFTLSFREIRDVTSIGPWQVSAFPMTHRPESSGYRLKDSYGVFAFSGDCAFDDKLFRLVDGVDLAIVELSMESQTDPAIAHVALDEVRRGIENLRAKRTVFSHIYDELSDLAAARGLHTASDGMVLEI